MNTKIIMLFFGLFISACAAERAPVPFPPKVIPVAEGGSILIQLNKGDITVLGGESGQVRVNGQTFFPDQTDYKAYSSNGQVKIIGNYKGGGSSNAPIHLEVYIPNHVSLKIDTEFASVNIHDYEGDLEAASLSGDILAENINGTIVARSNRGNVKIQNSAGKISMVGNYGMLTAEGVSGETGMSTIMGTITFNGLIDAGDYVHLETDHGPVLGHLSRDSALTLQVHSTSGDVACMLPAMTTTSRTCNGKLNSGEGELTIRTVSGAVTLQLMP